MYLFNRLRDLYETSRPGSTEYVLSRYFILNVNKIENISINDVVRDVSVSKSVISKFVKSISANQGFALFKSSLNLEMQYSYVSSNNYLKHYQDIKQFDFCKDYVDLEKIKLLVQQIKESKRIVFCGNDSKKSIFDHFINYLLIHGKDTKFASWIYSDYKEEELKLLNKDDLLVIVEPRISLYDYYQRLPISVEMNLNIDQLECKKFFIGRSSKAVHDFEILPIESTGNIYYDDVVLMFVCIFMLITYIQLS